MIIQPLRQVWESPLLFGGEWRSRKGNGATVKYTRLATVSKGIHIMIKFNVWFSIAQSRLHRKIRKCHFLWAETAIAMKSSSEGKEQHLPVMTRSFPVAEEGCTWWELGMALLQWHGAVSRAVQTQDHTVIPFRLGSLTPWEKSTTPFLSFGFDCSGVALFLQPLAVFDSVAAVHCLSCLLGLEEAPQISPAHTWVSHTHTVRWGCMFWQFCCLQPQLPSTDMQSFISVKMQFLGPWITLGLLFYLISLSTCLQVPTDSDIHS